MKMKRNLESLLISKSNFPVLVFAYFEFMFALVSIPVYAIIPSTWPLDANTVLDHKVFSKESDSF